MHACLDEKQQGLGQNLYATWATKSGILIDVKHDVCHLL